MTNNESPTNATPSARVEFPTAFGTRALVSGTTPGQIIDTNRAMRHRVVTQNINSTKNLIVGTWATLHAQHGSCHASMATTYPACLVPRTTCPCCSQALVHEDQTTTQADICLTTMVGKCKWSTGSVGCSWLHAAHNPRCASRSVDWLRYSNTVTNWLETKPSKENIALALSPTVNVPEQCDPTDSAAKRMASVFWKANVVKVCYMQFACKADLCELLTQHGHTANRILAVCDGPATKSEARFNPQNANAYNKIARTDNVFGSVASSTSDFSMVMGVSTHTKQPPDSTLNDATHRCSPRETFQPPSAPVESTSPVPQRLLTVETLDQGVGDGLSLLNATMDRRSDNKRACITQNVPTHNSSKNSLPPSSADTTTHNTSTTSIEAGSPAPCEPSSCKHHQVEVIVVPPAFMSLGVIQMKYYSKPVVLSEDEAIQRLRTQGVVPEAIEPIGERDPMCIRHGIGLPDHGHVGSIHPLPHNGCNEQRRPPRVIVVVDSEGCDKYMRVVAHEDGDNDLTRIIETPIQNARTLGRYEFLTSRHL